MITIINLTTALVTQYVSFCQGKKELVKEIQQTGKKISVRADNISKLGNNDHAVLIKKAAENIVILCDEYSKRKLNDAQYENYIRSELKQIQKTETDYINQLTRMYQTMGGKI
jgi:predicted transcriptional regulator